MTQDNQYPRIVRILIAIGRTGRVPQQDLDEIIAYIRFLRGQKGG